MGSASTPTSPSRRTIATGWAAAGSLHVVYGVHGDGAYLFSVPF
jgi:hypothetical protein